MKALEDYTWPGNVRQLQHLIERLVILAPGGRITAEVVEEAIASSNSSQQASDTLADTQTEQIRKVLAATAVTRARRPNSRY